MAQVSRAWFGDEHVTPARISITKLGHYLECSSEVPPGVSFADIQRPPRRGSSSVEPFSLFQGLIVFRTRWLL